MIQNDLGRFGVIRVDSVLFYVIVDVKNACQDVQVVEEYSTWICNMLLFLRQNASSYCTTNHPNSIFSCEKETTNCKQIRSDALKLSICIRYSEMEVYKYAHEVYWRHSKAYADIQFGSKIEHES